MPKMIEIEPGHTMGEKARCEQCGHLIEYVGPYWRHIDISPRHVAKPTASSEKAKAALDAIPKPDVIVEGA